MEMYVRVNKEKGSVKSHLSSGIWHYYKMLYTAQFYVVSRVLL